MVEVHKEIGLLLISKREHSTLVFVRVDNYLYSLIYLTNQLH